MVFVKLGAFLMFLVVTLGAFGAHALKDQLSAYQVDIWNKGVFYQALHALALFVVAWLASQSNDQKIVWAGWLMCTGVVFFSGSLYTLALTGHKWLGAITPIGGLLFLISWMLVFVSK